MNSDHTGHNRPKRRTPKYFYHTPFSYVALLLALTMVIPIPRVMPTPEVRADGANGSCETICDIFQGTCAPDPNDPDCTNGGGGGGGGGGSGSCLCNDGNLFFVSEGFPNACNTPLTCLNHGGWSGGGVDIGSCAQLKVFNGSTSCSADVLAFDPDSGNPVVDEKLFAGPQLDALEQQAINEVLTLHGLPATDKDLLLIWGRDSVRAQLFTKLVNIIDKADRTNDEQMLYNWLTNLVWQKRTEAAQGSWDQYRAWRNSVDYATCAWHSPNEKGIVEPNGTGTTTSPGCSLGLDGIPGTDSTPNAGSLEDLALGRDDGETCFNFHNFQRPKSLNDNNTPYYDALTLSRCAGVPVFWDVGLAAHPTVEEFLEYGQALARKNEIITPGFASVVGNTFKEEAFGIGVGASALAAAGTGLAVYAAGGWTLYTTKIAPFIARPAEVTTKLAGKVAQSTLNASAKAVGRAVSAVAAALVVLEVVFNIATIILTLLDIIEFNDIPIKLSAVVRAAAGTTETTVKISENYSFTSGKPNLATLIATDAGKQEIFYAFIETVAPEIDLSDTTAPAPDTTQIWNVRNQGAPVAPRPGSGHLLTFTAWDANKPYEKQTLGLFGGWFVLEAAASDGTVATTLELGMDYKDCDGEERRVWRVGGEEFISIPLGTDLTDVDFTVLSKSTAFEYLDWAGQCRIASIDHAPTPQGFFATGTLNEGSQVTLAGIASDPDILDNGNLVLTWDFKDGNTATGSPVQHAFADSGTFEVALTATDVFGATGPALTRPIEIANLPPTATFAPPATVNEGAPITLSLTNPSDPSTADTSAGFTHAFDCGSGLGSFGSSNTKSCPTTDNGSPTVKGQIKDKDGGLTEYSATASINNVPPQGSLLFATSEVPEGRSFTFSFVPDVVTNAFDPSSVDEASLQFAFNCGGDFGAFGGTNGISCPTTDNGTVAVAGRIKDKDNGMTESTGAMTVINVAPTATFTATPQIFQGESSMLKFSNQADPSPADTTAGFTYAYNCTTNGTLTVTGANAATAACKYLTTGTFTVGGTISDKDQGATNYTASVTVIAPQQAAVNLRTQVVALNLPADRTSDLTGKIDNALQKLAQGQKDGASKQLQDFIKKVNDLVRKKTLATAQGTTLTDIANRIIASIAVS